MKDWTSLSLRGVPSGRVDEAVYISTKEAEHYKDWDCFTSLAMTTYKGTNDLMNFRGMLLVVT
jgi:hypothetical protein